MFWGVSGGFGALREWEPEINGLDGGEETGQTSCVCMNLFLFEAEQKFTIYKNSLS